MLFLSIYSQIKQTDLTPLFLGWLLNTFGTMGVLLILKVSNYYAHEKAIVMNVIGTSVRFLVFLFAIVFVMIVAGKKDIFFFNHFCLSLIIIYFFNLAFEVIAFKKISN